jgi:hypothetical protein
VDFTVNVAVEISAANMEVAMNNEARSVNIVFI